MLHPSINRSAALHRENPGATASSSRRFYLTGIAIILAISLWLIAENRWEVDSQSLIGLIILALAARPALLWIKHSRSWFPTFEVSMLTCIPFYAIPLLAHHEELNHYPQQIITQSGILIVAYIIVASIFFSLWKRPFALPKFATEPLLLPHFHKYLPLGIIFNIICQCIQSFTTAIPQELARPLGALALGVGMLSTFISARLWGLNQIPPWQKSVTLIAISIQIILSFVGLYLITGISLFALTIISYSITRRNLPWVALGIFLPIVSILHLGKAQMRDIYWNKNPSIDDAHRGLEILPSYFAEWIGYGLLAEKIEKDTHVKKATIIDRASLMHIVCLSLDSVPSRKPYLKGETYLDIPAALVPRIFWKNKVSTLASTNRLGLYLGLLDEASIDRVSIAVGMLAESYLNFGYIGVIGLGALWGFGLNRLALASKGAPHFSALGILAILLTAWSLQVEQTAMTWVSSLLQAIILCIILPLLGKRITAQ